MTVSLTSTKHMPFKYSALLLWLFYAAPFFLPIQASSETVRVAVASNFHATLQTIAREFESNHPHHVAISSGSSGKLYAQITHGAPFDLFLSADQEKPRLLEERQLSTPETRATYALGQLALWSPNNDSGLRVKERFHQYQFQRLALANPKVAPYGYAAQSVLNRFAPPTPKYKKVVGENVAQVFHFVKTGNVDLGFVSLSQLGTKQHKDLKTTWIVPHEYYSPIKQDMVLLTKGQPNPAAVAFYNFILGTEAQNIIASRGYLVDTNDE